MSTTDSRVVGASWRYCVLALALPAAGAGLVVTWLKVAICCCTALAIRAVAGYLRLGDAAVSNLWNRQYGGHAGFTEVRPAVV